MPAAEHWKMDLKSCSYPGSPSAGPRPAGKSSGITMVVEFNLPLLVRSEDRPSPDRLENEPSWTMLYPQPDKRRPLFEIVGHEPLQLEGARVLPCHDVTSWFSPGNLAPPEPHRVLIKAWHAWLLNACVQERKARSVELVFSLPEGAILYPDNLPSQDAAPRSLALGCECPLFTSRPHAQAPETRSFDSDRSPRSG